MIIADKGARTGNFIIDSVLFILLILILAIILELLRNVLPGRVFYYFDWYILLFYFLYYFLFELFWGKTPGKFFTKTKVVNRLGERPKVIQLLIRSIMRLTPFYDHFSFIFGQGLHDRISNTRVVYTS
jgi:uncharacterized RDD family membrane protein YckC